MCLVLNILLQTFFYIFQLVRSVGLSLQYNKVIYLNKISLKNYKEKYFIILFVKYNFESKVYFIFISFIKNTCDTDQIYFKKVIKNTNSKNVFKHYSDISKII